MTEVSLGRLQHLADPYPELERLREAGPVCRLSRRPGLDPGWLVTRYDDVLAALADPRLSSDSRYARQPLAPRTGPRKGDLVASDPPDHSRLRKVVGRAFTPRRVESMRPFVQRRVDELLDAAVPAGQVDLRGEYAYPLAVSVIGEMLGLSGEYTSELGAWADALITPAVDEASAEASEQAWNGICGFFEKQADHKRAEPRDDMLSVLVAACDAGELSSTELVSLCVLLFISGFQSSVGLIVNGMRVLLDNPEQLDALRGDLDGLLEPAIEELIRYDGPVAFGPYRYTTEEVTIGGVVIPKGETVYLGLGTANRDPRRFDRPEVFDLGRRDNAHLGFGRGIHRCVGPRLARIEGGIAIGTLLRRFPRLAAADSSDQLSWRRSANRAVPERFLVALGQPR